MQIGVSVSIPASLSVRTTSSAASVPSTPSIFAAGRLGVEMRAEADRRLSTCRGPCAGRTSSPAHRHALRGRRPRRRCGTSRAPACPRGPASAAARRPWAWRRISRFRGWCPRAGRNRFAGWMRFWSFSLPEKPWCGRSALHGRTVRHHLSRHGALRMNIELSKQRTGSCREREILAEPAGPAGLPRRHGDDHGRRRQRLCAGQSRDPAGKTRGGVSPLLPAQSEAVSDHRHVRCRRSPHSRARARSRHPHRRAALPGLARRRGGRGADRHHGALARRSRRLRARLLVFVRGGADGGRSADPPHRAQGARADVPHQHRLRPAGPFAGPMVVSMRPFKPADAIRAVQITSRFPAVHGAPVHLGHPHSIGIADIAKPDYGDAVPVEADEIPVFWACGVTPQAVIAAAKLPFAITHAPGLMLVTDLQNKQLAVL